MRNHQRCMIPAVGGKRVRRMKRSWVEWKFLPFEVSAAQKVYRLCDTLNFHIPPISHSCISLTSYTKFIWFDKIFLECCCVPTWDFFQHIICWKEIKYAKNRWLLIRDGRYHSLDQSIVENIWRGVQEVGERGGGNDPLELSIIASAQGSWTWDSWYIVHLQAHCASSLSLVLHSQISALCRADCVECRLCNTHNPPKLCIPHYALLDAAHPTICQCRVPPSCKARQGYPRPTKQNFTLAEDYATLAQLLWGAVSTLAIGDNPTL